MPILYDLLCNGYFPRELPPTFNTSAFADLILSRGPSSSPDFSSGKCDALICEHSIPRSRTMRRKIGIPNPITQLLLCKELDNNWAELKNHIDLSPISLSKPWQNGTSLRAFLPHNNQGSLPQLRAKYRMGAKYLLKTDITNYYNSIYTHSIPWALHTKTISKEKRGINELLGNKLDYLVRNCRDCQTSGIPTGPDTSFLLSEILLSSIDREIANKLNGIKFKGFRYMDDYELCFSNYHDSEFALNQIDSALAEYGLGLNPKKTTIRKLPVPLEEYWVHELKTFGFREKAIAQKNDIISYFSRAFELSEQYPEQSVLRYAIAKFRSIN